MPPKKCLRKRTQEKVGSNQSPRVEIDQAATLTCIVAIKKHSKSLNLIQTYHNSTTQNQQLFSRSGATNTHQIQESTQRVLQWGERERSPHKWDPKKNCIWCLTSSQIWPIPIVNNNRVSTYLTKLGRKKLLVPPTLQGVGIRTLHIGTS
jgi:hypothetical protein